MNDSESIDARWLRERRRVAMRSGLGFGSMMFAWQAIKRTGLLAPIVGADVAPGGPFTLRWLFAMLGGALIAAVLFGFAAQWTVVPPSGTPTDT